MTHPPSPQPSGSRPDAEGARSSANCPANPARPRVAIKPRRAQPLFGRHPWVFAGAVHSVQPPAEPGDEVDVVSDRGEWIARGLFNPHSGIRVRLYSWSASDSLNDEFLHHRLAQAVDFRRQTPGLWGPDTACRLVFSEGDALSGLVVDRYGDWLLLQCTSLALYLRLPKLVESLIALVQPKGIWLRTEKGIREAEGLETADRLIWGEPPPRPLKLVEHGVTYEVDVVEGQKTGFFLDQRDNRLELARFARPGRLLDVCCYSGGFALNAARLPQITGVVALDVSARALELAACNARLNQVESRIEFRKGDAFDTLTKLNASGEKFANVVLDPPKLARHAAGLDEALRGYHGLNRLALQLIEPGGLLVTCSCTGHVTRPLFEQTVAKAAASAGRHVEVLANRGAAPDHPVSIHCPESDYLKALFCRVL